MRLVAALALLVGLSGCLDAAPGPDEHPGGLAPVAADGTTDAGPEPTPQDPQPGPTATPSPATPPPGVPPLEPDDAGPPPVIVAVIDTGIRPDHEAFAGVDIVAWYDFGKGSRSTIPSVLWDPDTEPYDGNGHGTAVASMVTGVGDHTPSHGRGVQLAVAKTSTPGQGHYWADVENAILWASDVVGADIITMSVYAYRIVLFPSGTDGGLAAIEHARGQGVLPVMLAGNGFDNQGLPTMSWMHPPASSPHALVVGGARADGSPVAPMGSMDPEVTALYSVRAACHDAPDCYRSVSGTSYSTPLVAGMAAHLLHAARQAGMEDPGPDRLEELLKHAAHDDPLYPPNLEGYGFLDADALAVAVEHLLAGTLPPRDAVGQASALYVETVQQAAREAWT